MRRLSAVAVALAIIAVGFAGSLVMLNDEERLKRLLAAHVENQLGRQLQIEGAVSLRFFPRLEIEVGKVRLSGSEVFEDMNLLTSDRLSARIRLAPLLRGRVETEELSLAGARLNLLFDDQGRHSLSGLLHRRDRNGQAGLLVNGPLRLENLSLQIGRLGSQALQQVSVERMELDGLAFDRALSLVFEGAVGDPALVEDVALSGVLFVPAGTGRFRLADMTMRGKSPGAISGFELSGTLDFSALPPLDMVLSDGVLTVGDQRARVEGRYEARPRPYFAVELSGDTLNAERLGRAFGLSGAVFPLALVTGWTALHDYDLNLQAATFELGGWPLTNAVVQIGARDQFAEIQAARASLPGGTLEVLGDLAISSEASLLSLQARIEIDHLAATLAAAGAPIQADGVGQVLIEPLDEGLETRLAGGTFQFFDGFVADLAPLRAAMSASPGADYDVAEGSFVLSADRIEFPGLRINRDQEQIQFKDLSFDKFRNISGQARLSGAANAERVVRLSGTLQQPQFSEIEPPASNQ